MSESIELSKEQKAVADRVVGWIERAAQYVCHDAETYKEGGGLIKAIKALKREADRVFDKIINKQKEALAIARSTKKEIVDPLDRAEAIFKTKTGGWWREEEDKREEEKRKLEAKAKAVAEAERDKEVAEAREAGGDVLAEAIAQQPVEDVKIEVESKTPKVDGISHRTLHRGRVIDKRVFLRYVIGNCKEDPDLLDYVKIDEGKLNKWATRTKGAETMPGIEHYTDTNTASK